MVLRVVPAARGDCLLGQGTMCWTAIGVALERLFEPFDSIRGVARPKIVAAEPDIFAATQLWVEFNSPFLPPHRSSPVLVHSAEFEHSYDGLRLVGIACENFGEQFFSGYRVPQA